MWARPNLGSAHPRPWTRSIGSLRLAIASLGMRNYVDILSPKPYTYNINYHFSLYCILKQVGNVLSVKLMRAIMEAKMQYVDALVIGGGVVGCAILRELSRYDAEVALLERNPDICEGTSRSNSAIVHTVFDAPPRSLESQLLAEAREVCPSIVESLHIPYLQTGALMVATDAGELATIETEIIPKAERNGVMLQSLTPE